MVEEKTFAKTISGARLEALALIFAIIMPSNKFCAYLPNLGE
jgi:hypothetical protein